MLSIGSAAYTADKKILSTFSANLETLPEACAHPKTAAWWATQPDAWAACRKDLESPVAAMTRYAAWLKSLPRRIVFVAYPAGFDFVFVYWYLIRFAGEDVYKRQAFYVASLCLPPQSAQGAQRSCPS